MKLTSQITLAVLVIGGVFLPACAAAEDKTVPSPTVLIELVPFHTATASSTPTPLNPATPTPLPSPTPTPLTYTVQTGDSFGGIALRYKISVAALQGANPKVDPNMISIGTVLIIPVKAGASADVPTSSTPIGITLGKVYCDTNQDGGIWCFVPAYNRQSIAVESVSAIIRIAGKGSTQVLSQPASALLDLIPAKSTLALSAYFPPSVPAFNQASAEILTALPVLKNDQRYLSVRIDNPQYQVNQDKLTAQVSGKVVLNVNKAKAKKVWVAAVVYDLVGDVVGLRRWESNTSLFPGAGLDFSFNVYSISEPIGRVEMLAEARP
jgi:LysM repeat protein